jgi:hypothetical protein
MPAFTMIGPKPKDQLPEQIDPDTRASNVRIGVSSFMSQESDFGMDEDVRVTEGCHDITGTHLHTYR